MSAGRHIPGAKPGFDPSRIGVAWRGLVLVAVLFLHAWTVAASAWAATFPEATGLRFGENGPRTRVVVDFDRPVAFDANITAKPARLVLDLENVVWRLPADAGRTLRGLVRGHAIDAAAGGTRLTVDMARPVRIVGAILLPPNKDSVRYRLVVDMVADGGPVAAAAPARAARPPIPTAAPAAVPVPVSRPIMLAGLPSAARALNGHRVTAPDRSKGRDLPIVILDPGHGGIDPGATSISGEYEKELVLNMARELRSLIEKSGRYRVVLTRDGDEFIRLRDRIATARKLGGQFFISLHADSLRFSDQRGASIYTLSEKASDDEAARFAVEENQADILTGADLSQHDAVVATILIDLAQRDTNNKSIAFADIMADELAKVTSLVKRHRRFAGFAVLKSPDIPSVLLELGYLSNPEDARNLARPNYRAKLGQAIVRSLDQYFAVPRS